jgi:hypothetical protein
VGCFEFLILLRCQKPGWYVIVVKPNQEDVDDREIEATLRHLWMFQLSRRPTLHRTVHRESRHCELLGVGKADWVELAKEAYHFVKRGKS